MTKDSRIDSFVSLKEVLEQLDGKEKDKIFSLAVAQNPWFTKDNVTQAIKGICTLLDTTILSEWLNNYDLPVITKDVGVVMAGNIPFVGFHDLLCVLIAGHRAVIKLSSQDQVLPNFIINKLREIDSDLGNKILLVERLPKTDAVIATGSDNSSRYFRKYFKDIPHIIRKNRISVAVLKGDETEEDINLLGEDIFSYFGLGCRNVAKIFVPQGYNLLALLDSFENYREIINHSKYFNNYEYNKAIYLVNQTTHLDTGFALFSQTSELVSPLAVIYYEEYSSLEDLNKILDQNNKKIQCIVGASDINSPQTAFGKSQFPNVDDYADGIDTMRFLCDLK